MVSAEVIVDDIPHTCACDLSDAIQIAFLLYTMDLMIGRQPVFAHYEWCHNHCCTFQWIALHSEYQSHAQEGKNEDVSTYVPCIYAPGFLSRVSGKRCRLMILQLQTPKYEPWLSCFWGSIFYFQVRNYSDSIINYNDSIGPEPLIISSQQGHLHWSFSTVRKSGSAFESGLPSLIKVATAAPFWPFGEHGNAGIINW